MSPFAISLAQQFKFQAWKNTIHSLNHRETKKLLLIAVRQSIDTKDLLPTNKITKLGKLYSFPE